MEWKPSVESHVRAAIRSFTDVDHHTHLRPSFVPSFFALLNPHHFPKFQNFTQTETNGELDNERSGRVMEGENDGRGDATHRYRR